MKKAKDLSFFCFGIFLLTCLNFNIVYAAPPSIKVLGHQTHSVGSLVRIEITIPRELQEENTVWSVTFDSPEKWVPHGPLLINAYSLEAPRDRKKYIRLRGIILDKGSKVIPPFQIYREGEEEKIETGVVFITGKSSLTPADKAPIWLLGPLGLHALNKPLIGIFSVLGLILVLLLLFFLWRKWRTPKKVIPLLPIEIFERRAKKLQDQAGDWKLFSFGLSLALREFLSKELNVNCLESTDRELIIQLRGIPLSESIVVEIEKILLEIKESRYSIKVLSIEETTGLIRKSGKLIRVCQSSLHPQDDQSTKSGGASR